MGRVCLNWPVGPSLVEYGVTLHKLIGLDLLVNGASTDNTAERCQNSVKEKGKEKHLTQKLHCVQILQKEEHDTATVQLIKNFVSQIH
jgi:hypothetical protein